MHVGLNLIFLVPGETGGMEVYARELLLALVEAAPDTRFTAFINQEASAAGGGPWGELIEAVTVPVKARKRLEWVRGEQQLLPRLARQRGVDLLHSLASTAPVWGRFRRVVTIHDLNYRIVPDAHLGLMGLGMRLLVPLAARRSHRIIVPAQASKDDLVQLLNTPAAKIDVVHEGFGATRTTPPMPEAEVRAWLRAGERQIVLSASAKRPHKNLVRLSAPCPGFRPNAARSSYFRGTRPPMRLNSSGRLRILVSPRTSGSWAGSIRPSSRASTPSQAASCSHPSTRDSGFRCWKP